jgi:hypothetical protein
VAYCLDAVTAAGATEALVFSCAVAWISIVRYRLTGGVPSIRIFFPSWPLS